MQHTQKVNDLLLLIHRRTFSIHTHKMAARQLIKGNETANALYPALIWAFLTGLATAYAISF